MIIYDIALRLAYSQVSYDTFIGLTHTTEHKL